MEWQIVKIESDVLDLGNTVKLIDSATDVTSNKEARLQSDVTAVTYRITQDMADIQALAEKRQF